MRVLVVAEYYPRATDPVRGIWAHRQALSTRDAGAEVRVLVLHRPLPSLHSVRDLDLPAAAGALRQPRQSELDGLRVDYVHYLSPPRPWSYASWGAWAAPVLAAKLRRLRHEFPFDLIHAHYAVPAGDAVRRAAPHAPLLLSIHGHDVYGDLARSRSVRATLAHARIVLANSAGTARRSRAAGAHRTRVVHLGADPLLDDPVPGDRAHGDGACGERAGGDLAVADTARRAAGPPRLVSVANLVARKRHADVISALALLSERHPGLRYVIVGDGPERERLRALAASLGVERQVELRGALAHKQAVTVAQACTLFVLPSVEEAFGVAYVEAMAAGVPAIGSSGEDGPEEIAAAGPGIALVPAGDVRALTARIDSLLRDPVSLQAMGRDARATVQREFTWKRCGEATVDAYEQVLREHRSTGRK